MATNAPLASTGQAFEQLEPFQVPGVAATNESTTVPDIPSLEPASREPWRPDESVASREDEAKVVEPNEETQSGRPPAPEYILLEQWEAHGSGGPYLPEEAASWEEQRDEKPYDGREIVAYADAALDDVMREAIEAFGETLRKLLPWSSFDALPDHREAPGSGDPNLPEEPSSREEQHDENPCDESGMVASAGTALADVEREASDAFGETHRESPPSSSADALPDHWEAPGSSDPNLPDEPSSREEQHDKNPCDESGMVASADTALADVEREVISEDASLVSKNMFEFLASGKSTVKGVPVGVYTLKALPKGLHFGPYHGVKVDCIENGGCTWPVRRCGEFFVVDGRPQQRNHWMNDVNYTPSKSRQNLVALLLNGDIYYRTLRNIGPGEELLIRYSTSFTKSLLGSSRGPGALKGEDINIIPLHSLFLACKKCGDLFTKQYNMEMHTRWKHWNSTEGIHNCTHCSYTSTRKVDIIRHQRTHVGRRESVCHLCQKRFSQPDNLKIHMMIHSGDKPYECGQCSKRFRQRVHARRHEQVIHSRRYPLTCPRCGAGAEDVTKLRRHTCKPLGTTEGKEGFKRGRGRPRLMADGTAPKVRPRNTAEGTPLQVGVKRGRGRPRKVIAQDASAPAP